MYKSEKLNIIGKNLLFVDLLSIFPWLEGIYQEIYTEHQLSFYYLGGGIIIGLVIGLMVSISKRGVTLHLLVFLDTLLFITSGAISMGLPFALTWMEEFIAPIIGCCTVLLIFLQPQISKIQGGEIKSHPQYNEKGIISGTLLLAIPLFLVNSWAPSLDWGFRYIGFFLISALLLINLNRSMITQQSDEKGEEPIGPLMVEPKGLPLIKFGFFTFLDLIATVLTVLVLSRIREYQLGIGNIEYIQSIFLAIGLTLIGISILNILLSVHLCKILMTGFTIALCGLCGYQFWVIGNAGIFRIEIMIWLIGAMNAWLVFYIINFTTNAKKIGGVAFVTIILMVITFLGIFYASDLHYPSGWLVAQIPLLIVTGIGFLLGILMFFYEIKVKGEK